MQAYAKALSAQTIKWSRRDVALKGSKFAIVYLNKDDIPELLVSNSANASHADGYESIYTYKDGKVLRLGGTSAYFTGYYPRKNLIRSEDMHMGVETEIYSVISGKILKDVLLRHKEEGRKGRTYYYKCVTSKKKKAIDNKQYQKMLKKRGWKKKATKIYYYENTFANRKAILGY